MSKNISIFRKNGDMETFIAAYDKALKLWKVPYEELMIPTRLERRILWWRGLRMQSLLF